MADPDRTREDILEAGDAFLGAEATILLGISEEEIPSRNALRRVGAMIRQAEEAAVEDER